MHQVEPRGEWKDEQSQVKKYDPKLGPLTLDSKQNTLDL